ncbi:MAG: response regulator transcription factor [Firmicutes bacterium]|nr:response regulator transcription factor [Bacillota bacterium]
MCKVLIVDDERIIREGIAAVIPWGKYGFTLVGTAANGEEAYEIIKKEALDIVISDIKMPGMNGLQLIAKVKEEQPAVEFVVLSGYGEFEFARTAMQYGVKYYLLKPCNEEEILEVLEELRTEIEQRKRKEAHLERVKQDLERIKPQLKAQFLKEFVTNQFSFAQEWEYYQSLLGFKFETWPVRLLLCRVEGKFEFEYLFASKQTAEEILGEELVFLSTTIGEELLLLIKDLEMEELLTLVESVKQTFYEYYGRDMTIAISESGEWKTTPLLYREAREYLKHRFYLGEGSIITEKDISFGQMKETNLIFDFEQFGYLVKSGNTEEVQARMEEFFRQLEATTREISGAKIHCLDLFSTIIRHSAEEVMNDYLKRIVDFEEFTTLEQIHRFIAEIALEITAANYAENAQRYSRQVQKVVTLVEENLANENLSLKWLAQEMLYMNVDYLGKLFKKEMNERFSDYLIRLRIEKAKEMLENSDSKVFEIAKAVGFGDNAQYFSQVFKKQTGYTPSDYKKLFHLTPST